ncbi:MAG TPA: hypothetical protein VJV79_25815 [Polyangiaceae bacterium]|nr:hypothetical protein [Polyangiaceae bacterium]
MNPFREQAPRPWQLAAYLDGELAASDTAAVERYLAESSDARRELEQLSLIRAELSSSGQEFEQVDLLPSIKARIRERTAVRARADEGWMARLIRRPAAGLLATGVLAAAVCLAVAFAPRDRSTREFRAKAASDGIDPARWAGVQAYRVRAGKSEPLGETMARTDGLLFSYTNLGREPLTNLMVFAVDSAGKVHWFHPAYEREGSNPSSIVIEKGAAQVPLAELIQDEFPPGPLAIHALFSNAPLHVLEVEGWLKGDPRTNLVSRVPASVDQVLTTRIEP